MRDVANHRSIIAVANTFSSVKWGGDFGVSCLCHYTFSPLVYDARGLQGEFVPKETTRKSSFDGSEHRVFMLGRLVRRLGLRD